VAPRFLVPSLVWYGLEPALAGPTLVAGTKPLSQWGGQLSDEDAVRAVLLTVDPAILLLVLAGYQVRTVVAAVPVAASETAVTDLVNVDLATMRIQRGSLLEWTDPDSSRADAQVALWVEPRYPSVRPGPSGVTLDLSTLQTPLDAQGIDLLFWDDGTGWLRFSWAAGPGSWVGELPGRVDRFVSVARTELATLYASAQPASSGLVVAGLLSAYDPATWTVAGDTALPPALTGFGARVAEAALGGGEPGLSAFLAGELPVPDDQHPVVFGGVRPPAAAERFAAADAQPELDACVDEAADRALAADPAAPAFATDAATDVTALSLTELLLRWQEHDVLDVLSLIAPEEDRYGGYDLRTGDTDIGAVIKPGTAGAPPVTAAAPVYGGVQRSADAGDTLPPAGTIGYIAQLRRDLAELGFGPAYSYQAGEASAQQFTVDLELAVRELQIAATYPNVAWQGVQGQPVFYADTLAPVENEWRYGGPISGVVNAGTRTLIGTWLDRQLRCPIIIEARAKDAKGNFTQRYAAADSDNVWRDDQLKDTAPRFYARDLSGQFALEADSARAGRKIDDVPVGAWTSTPPFGSGPWAPAPSQVWKEREVLPEVFLGAPFSGLTAAQRSTFRVVRAVAEVECTGYFDVYNAYDSAIFSIGLCHWTIALTKAGKISDAPELPALFAYMLGRGGTDAEEATAVLGRYGCSLDRQWPGGTSREAAGTDPHGPWYPSERKYVARVALDGEADGETILQGNELARVQWFRHWHWCHRFAMAARTRPLFRRRMWDYARFRLRDLLATPWVPALMTTDPGGGTRPATVGDLFTSERAAGLLLRWHVNAPGDLLPVGPKSKLTAAFTAAGAAAWGDPAGWNDQREAALTEALYAARPAVAGNWLRLTLDQVYHWASTTSWTVPAKAGTATKTWASVAKSSGWTLTAATVSWAPVVSGLTNRTTAVGAAAVIPFTVDAKDIIGAPRTPTAASSDQSVVRDNGLAVAPDGAGWRLSATPVPGASGLTTITVTADNGAHTTKATFSLRVGAPGNAPDPVPAVSATDGLSVRRHSLQLDVTDLP